MSTVTPLASAQDEDGHTNYVNVVDWNADGTTLATGSTDETIRFWDESGALIDIKKSTIGHNGSVLDIEWMHSEETLLSGSVDRSLISWNTTQDVTFANAESKTFSGILKFVKLNPNENWLSEIHSNFEDGNFTDDFLSTIKTYNLINTTFRLDLETNLVAVAGDETSVTFYLHTPQHPVYAERMVEIGNYIINDRVKGLTWDASGTILGIATRNGKVLAMNITEFFFGTFLKTYQKPLTEDQTTAANLFISQSILLDQETDYTIKSLELSGDGLSYFIATTEGVFIYEPGAFGVWREIGSIPVDCSSCLNIGIEFDPVSENLAVAMGKEVAIYPFDDRVLGEKLYSLNTETDLGFTPDILAVDVDFNPTTGNIAIAAGADVIVYDSTLTTEVWRVVGSIPVPSNIVFTGGVVIALLLVAIFLIRRQLRKGKL